MNSFSLTPSFTTAISCGTEQNKGPPAAWLGAEGVTCLENLPAMYEDLLLSHEVRQKEEQGPASVVHDNPGNLEMEE